jgi:FAD/FMN-containing dehydrogenase
VDLSAFAREVGADGPVCVAGGRTQWSVGGHPAPGSREVSAPAGVVAHYPDEMIVRCGAGTPVSELDAAVGEYGQFVALPRGRGATVGGVLAVGQSGVTRLGHGPVRDTVLEVRAVNAAGQPVRAGAPVVKNVTGFDLCRLLVGSLGTLLLMAEVVLRCRPRPAVSRWFAGPGDPFELRRRVHRPTSVLWDGATTWICLEGHGRDVDVESAALALDEVAGPPALPTGGRHSLPPSELRSLGGRFVAEIGVGIVHTDDAAHAVDLAPRLRALHESVKARFDPTGRLNPGRSVL